ncbi:MAG: DUF4091 domain-containing protein [Victivallales bacterium]|nr:DUF4091 domain-containing protein [Victivallales bacterium]
MKYKYLLFAILCLSIIIRADDLLQGGFVLPDIQSNLSVPANNVFQLRKRKTAYLAPDAAGKLSFTIGCGLIGRYTDTLRYSLNTLDGKTLQEGSIPVKEQRSIELTNLPQEVLKLTIDLYQNSTLLRVSTGRCAVEASSGEPLHLINGRPKMFFMVNSGSLKMKAIGDKPIEHVAITICDADGQVVFEGNSVGNKEMTVSADVPIADNQAGRIWSIQFSRVPNQGFEDMELQILDGALPVVALEPNQLIFPLFHKERKALENGDFFLGIAVAPWLDNQKGLSAEFAFLPDGMSKPTLFNVGESWTAVCPFEKPDATIARDSNDNELSHLVGIRFAKDDFLSGKIHFTAYDANKKPFAELSWKTVTCDGKTFTEIPWKDPQPAVEPTAEDIARGFQLFQREEPGFVRPNSRPATDEIRSEIKGETSPGLVSCEFFAFMPLKDMTGVVAIGDLSGPSTVAKDSIKLLWAEMSSQRTDWNATTYITAPERLLPVDGKPDKFIKDYPAEFCIRATVPTNAKPGVYNAPILLDGKPVATYTLTIDDFTLPEYHDMTFGLYADGQRWVFQNFTDDEILREMRMFREHGMNALMMYPFYGAKVTYDGKDFYIDMSRFRHLMKLYCQVGFPGVAVISFQAVNGYLMRALQVETADHTPEFVRGFHELLETIRTMAKEDGWPDYCIHTVDEPNKGRGGDEAIRTLKLVKEAGFKTFNTCYGDFVREHLAPWLDYRCYNNIAYMSCRTKEANDTLRKESLDDGDIFWWYGSGCYTNGGLQQDCNIYTNRHMLGIFNWRSGATGAWTWTFLRVNGSPYNDFDGNDKREAKDACICYPQPQGNGLIDTLQWEAIREGVYDYRYIRLWDDLCKKAAATADKAAIAAQSRERIQKTMDSINWNCLNFSVSNAQLRTLRAQLIEEIKRLK